MLKGIFVYSKREHEWAKSLHGQPTLSQEWETHFRTLPLNEARLTTGEILPYTQCHTEPYDGNPLLFAFDHARRWGDTVILGFGEIHSIRGSVMF